MPGQMQLSRGGQAVASVVAASADHEGMPAGEPRPHHVGDAQGGTLHEHGSRHADVPDRGPVHLPHLGGGEHRRMVEEGTRARHPSFPGDAREPPGHAARCAGRKTGEVVRLASTKDVRDPIHLATSPRTRDDRQARSSHGIDVRERHLEFGDS